MTGLAAADTPLLVWRNSPLLSASSRALVFRRQPCKTGPAHDVLWTRTLSNGEGVFLPAFIPISSLLTRYERITTTQGPPPRKVPPPLRRRDGRRNDLHCPLFLSLQRTSVLFAAASASFHLSDNKSPSTKTPQQKPINQSRSATPKLSFLLDRKFSAIPSLEILHTSLSYSPSFPALKPTVRLKRQHHHCSLPR